MQSTLHAITWEMLKRGRWSLILGMLGANVWPIFILAWFRLNIGPFDTLEDQGLVHAYFALVQINMFTFGAAIFSAQGPPSRLYAYPIRTEALVAYHFLLTMVFIATETAASTSILNALFGTSWPLWGPALFSAAALVAIQATFWLIEKSAWLPSAVAVVGIATGIWFKSRFGPTFSDLNHLWIDATPWEVLTLLALIALSYCVAVKAVARNRRGEPPISLGIITWLQRVLDQPPATEPSFRSPAQAQFWFEWQKKGWLMPNIVAFVLVLGTVGWLIFSRDPKDLVVVFVIGGGPYLSMVGLIGGLVFGNTGSKDFEFDLGHFLGTRPMKTAELSRTILKTAALSFLIAYAIWGLAFLSFFGILFVTKTMPEPFLPSETPWWYFPAALLSSWTILAITTSIGLVGRWKKRFGELVMGLLALAFVLVIVAQMVLPNDTKSQLFYGVATICGTAFVLGTAWVFADARRRSLIGRPTLFAAAGLWAVLSMVVVLERAQNPAVPIPMCIFAVGFLAAAVAPLAAAPLALMRNRSR